MARILLDFLREQCRCKQLKFKDDDELLQSIKSDRYPTHNIFKKYLDAREVINEHFPMLFEYSLEVGTHGSNQPMTVKISIDDQCGWVQFPLSELPKQKEKIIQFILKIVYDEGINTGKHKEKIKVGKFLREYTEIAKHL